MESKAKIPTSGKLIPASVPSTPTVPNVIMSESGSAPPVPSDGRAPTPANGPYAATSESIPSDDRAASTRTHGVPVGSITAAIAGPSGRASSCGATPTRVLPIPANTLRSSAPDSAAKTRTCGPPPGPAPVNTSDTPSPSQSPAATDTPPRKDGSYAIASNVTAPVARSKPRRCGPPPTPGPVKTRPVPSFATPSATVTPPVNDGS